MSIHITPVVSVSAKKGMLEFKVRGKERWVIEKLYAKVEKWCEKQGITVERGW